jgi:hypothetical protein
MAFETRHPASATRRGVAILPPLLSPILWAFVLWVSVFPQTAAAHGGSSGPHAGIAVPSLSHGEMAIIAPYYGRIVALAASANDTNEPFRRVLNFAQIQRTYCLWGIMPGSVADEDSPFNECSHAYLAAAKLLLLQMRDMVAEKQAAGELVSEIDARLVQSGLSLTLCRFSNESFDTAALIRPDRGGIVFHAESLLTVIAAIAAAALLFFSAGKLWRTPLRPVEDRHTRSR